MSTLSDSLDRLASLHPKLIDLGLDRTFQLLQKAGNPQQNLPPVIHIAGTNGKGSVSAFLNSLAQHMGLTVHCYTSPHLCQFNERIRLANHLINDIELIDLLKEIEQLNENKPITFYEITTVAAFLAFARKPADLTILETGLGGRLDSTNVVANPLACIITPIARDHEHFLGSELPQIAGEKAGIMRHKIPVICASQTKEVAHTLVEKAEAVDAPIHIEGRDFTWEEMPSKELKLEIEGHSYLLPKPSLFGPHQQQNAVLASAAIVYSKHFKPLSDTLFAGIAYAKWPGRVQLIDKGELIKYTEAKQIWLDGAHNMHGSTALAKALAHITDKKWTLIAGMLNTRKPADLFTPLKNQIEQVFTITIPGQDASLSAQKLSDECSAIGIKSTAKANLISAVSATNDAEFVIICGSLYLAGHVLLTNGTLPD
ncbi:bifunctional folylpolyglutamate synthase/dihydrofolate synthase [Alphaproteobacteria bacterium]|jgi:dihydrofolate synthase / folylpolyglutamate synthase|nr:bifunctional folylpolyglutamate synthase/dihydrofolate synthase [Alphaproteobacteria bacterium]MBT5799446.1 bifunctional folylpolyglutamate synthase/dihydrofolate synthase [Alphaproteobacteria bacterium]MDA9815926.1 bifunctional folylpolyglutamate synthase/dihydrofolate synthase [Alphaproteobacteria bacterium]MDC0394312.1 bifunctional folylpolyglutamate synthase/dihydrofolate synthase [Alphaproteobacteria bacterium]